jgi:hypothetical protein
VQITRRRLLQLSGASAVATGAVGLTGGRAPAYGQATFLSTVRIGPLTSGAAGPAEQEPRPLQDTTRWGVNGVDEGVSVFFKDQKGQNRTYIYFGDVRPNPDDPSYGETLNTDLIAWTSDPDVQTHGGHSALGWTFFLPNNSLQSGPASTQQPNWRYCVKCFSLFYCPTGTGAGRCPYDNGLHIYAGYEFYLPNLEQGAPPSMGQPDWHYCGKCNGLCYAPNMVPTGSCPAGGTHAPIGFTFFLPNNMQGATSATGQPDWRYCGYCTGLFFDGYLYNGACPSAPGGGLRLTPVLGSGTPENGGQFYPFQGEPLVGATKSLERPGGAFVWNDRVYVFANVAAPWYSGKTRPGNPQFGTYLLSTSAPDQPTPLTTHYLISPRIGKCTLADGEIRSHQPLGLYFYIPLAPAEGSTSWRRCKWCEGLFTVVSGNPGHCFGNPAGHSPYADSLLVNQGSVDNADHQSNWRLCAKCLMLFFNGYTSKDRCPAGGTHDPGNSPSYSMTFSSGTNPDDPTGAQADDKKPDGGWRYCSECQCMVFTKYRPGNADGLDNTIGGATPYVVTAADHPDLPASPSTGGIAFSGQAAVMISHRFGTAETGARPYHYPGFVLACWHLPVGAAPRLQDLLYFDPEALMWTPDVSVLADKNLFDYTYNGKPNHDGYYTETGLLWLPGPRRWMLTYTQGQAPSKPGALDAVLGPVYARFAERITDLGTAADIPIFDPTRPADRALLVDGDSYPYGPYPLEAYTSWDPRMGILDLYYLLSLFNPYQVQLMRTQIRVP